MGHTRSTQRSAPCIAANTPLRWCSRVREVKRWCPAGRRVHIRLLTLVSPGSLKGAARSGPCFSSYVLKARRLRRLQRGRARLRRSACWCGTMEGHHQAKAQDPEENPSAGDKQSDSCEFVRHDTTRCLPMWITSPATRTSSPETRALPSFRGDRKLAISRAPASMTTAGVAAE